MSMLSTVTGVTVLDHYWLRLTFDDGLTGDVDVSYLAIRGGVFAALHDPEYFAMARVDSELGTVVWPNGADLAPEVLYENARESRRRP